MQQVSALLVFLGVLSPGLAAAAPPSVSLVWQEGQPEAPQPETPEVEAPEAEPAKAAQADQSVIWEDLVLPLGFHLDLATGRVADRPEGDAEGLRYDGKELVATDGAVGLLPDGSRLAGQLARGAMIHGSRWKAVREQLLGFDLGTRGWGFLRVLEVTPGHVRLERWAHAGGAPGVANWRATRLDLTDLGRKALVLEPLASRSGGPWRVEGRDVGGDRDWQVLGEWDGATPFTDSAASRDSIRELRLVPLTPEGLYGLRARGVFGTHEGPITVVREDQLNLLTGESHGERHDVTVAGSNPNGINLTPSPGVRLMALGTAELDDWLVPEHDSGSYTGQGRYLPAGRAFAAILPEGTYVHVQAIAVAGSSVQLTIRANLWGERLFLPAPAAPGWTWTAERGVLLDAAEEPPLAVAGRIAGRELQRETVFDTGIWETVGVAAPGLEQRDPASGPIGVVRYRCAWLARSGERGPISEPFGVFVGDDRGPDSAALIEQLVTELGDEDYDRRRHARAGLHALGERALPYLPAAAQSPDPEVAAAARELLADLSAEPGAEKTEQPEKGAKAPKGGKPDLAGAKGGDELPDAVPALGDSALLASLAEARGLGEAPAGWLAERGNERALAMLVSLDGAQDDREAWRALLAEADPDPGVRLIASLYPELARPWAWAPRFLPTAEDDSEGLAARATRDLNAGDPWPSLARLHVLHDLQLARGGGGNLAAAEERAALVLQLLQRHAEGKQEVFLDAALQVVTSPEARLRAARNLFELRAHSRDSAENRTEIVLAAADGALLRDTLEGMRNSENTQIDLILPEGDYELEHGDLRGVRVYGDGLRIVGRGQVTLSFGLMVQPKADVVLENITLDPEGRACLRLQQSNAVLIGCQLLSAGQGVQVTGGVLELRDSSLVDSGTRGRKGGNGIRLSGRSACLVLRSLVAAQGEALFGASLALVERSVLDGGPRNAISAMSEGELIAVDSLIRGEANALHTIGQGVLEGCALLGGDSVAMQLGDRFFACPAHLVSAGPEGDRNEWMRLLSCPVGR